MPLIIEGPVPSGWQEKGKPRAVASIDSHARGAECVSLALINNMPDSALEDTELQFFELLDAASGDVPVFLKLHSLPGIPRTERGQRHLSSFYLDFGDLWKSRFDGLIVTGTEPHHANLRDEPYWDELVNLLEWAERSTASTVLSCLAAHASVLHSDHIRRHPLSDKKFGVFDSRRVRDHALTADIPDMIRFPHSRWNEVREDELTACGYVVLTQSSEAGVDLFAKNKKKSLFVHFQGHPEYGVQTLLKEYRRDVKRFLRRERETYPSMPRGYFDTAATGILGDFQQNALSDPREERMTHFPEAVVAKTLHSSWHSSAKCVYRNWLQYVLAKKADTASFAAITSLYSGVQRKRSAVL